MQSSNQTIKPLDIDIEQWQRDIETFVATTQRELAAIIQQLAPRFSQSTDFDCPPQTQVPNDFDFGARESADAPTSQSNTQERLASIKQKLANKIKP